MPDYSCAEFLWYIFRKSEVSQQNLFGGRNREVHYTAVCCQANKDDTNTTMFSELMLRISLVSKLSQVKCFYVKYGVFYLLKTIIRTTANQILCSKKYVLEEALSEVSERAILHL